MISADLLRCQAMTELLTHGAKAGGAVNPLHAMAAWDGVEWLLGSELVDPAGVAVPTSDCRAKADARRQRDIRLLQLPVSAAPLTRKLRQDRRANIRDLLGRSLAI